MAQTKPWILATVLIIFPLGTEVSAIVGERVSMPSFLVFFHDA